MKWPQRLKDLFILQKLLLVSAGPSNIEHNQAIAIKFEVAIKCFCMFETDKVIFLARVALLLPVETHVDGKDHSLYSQFLRAPFPHFLSTWDGKKMRKGCTLLIVTHIMKDKWSCATKDVLKVCN